MPDSPCLLILATLTLAAGAQGTPCPAGMGMCSCDDKTIDCSKKNLTSFPPYTGSVSIQTQLDISDNFIRDLDAGSLPPGLRKFRSLGNPLTYISNEAFNGSENTMVDITIEMSNADLRQLSNAMLAFTALQTLSLGHNNITHEFDVDDFIFPETLTHLFLDDNHMTRVPPGISNLPVIQEIDVSSNDITELNSAVYPAALTDLYASHNDISYLPRLQFSAPSNLKILVLAENPVTGVEDLSALTKLRTLDLTGAHLTTLPLAVQSLPNLGELNLSDVRTLNCTCAEAELSAWFKAVSPHITGSCIGGSDITYFLQQMTPHCPGAGLSVPIG